MFIFVKFKSHKLMDELFLYTIEFHQKPYLAKRRGIVDALMYEYTDRIKRASKTFKTSPALQMIGGNNNDRIRYAHFFSDLSYYEIKVITEAFAREKTFDYYIKQKTKQKAPVFGKGGKLENFFKQKLSLTEIFKF